MRYKCLRCHHLWNSRKKEKPITCPKCKSPYWNKPLKRPSKDYIAVVEGQIIKLHTMIIKESGGEPGIRDKGGIYNAAYRIVNYTQKYHDSPTKVGAFIFEDLAKRHHFIDGNKRTAYCYAKVFLMVSGYHLKVDYQNAVSFILEVARYENPKTLKEIEQWLKKNIEKIPTNKIENYLKELFYDITYGRKEREV